MTSRACFARAPEGALRLAVSMLTLLAGGSLLCGCATRAAFDTSFPPNRAQDLNGVLARVRQAPRAPQMPVVIGVRDEPRGVFAFDLRERRMLFSETTEVVGLPLAAGPYAVVPERGAVRVRALTSGQVVNELAADGMRLVGADGDGEVTAISLSTGGSYEGRSQLVILRGGSVTAKLTTKYPLGAPAVLGGLVFVPHSRVHLSVLSPEGEELARVRVRDDVASQALSDGQHVFFGMAGLYLLDEQTPQGVQGGAHYFAPDVATRRKLPGAPNFLRDTTEAPAPVESAVHRIRLSFWPAATGTAGVGLANDALYLSFYRLVFGLDASGKQTRWVRSTQSDAVGLQAGATGVVVVEERGTVSVFDADGALQLEADMGAAPIVATVRAEGLPTGSAGDPLPALVVQLTAAALHEDTRLAPGGELAARALAQLPERDATSALIEICGSSQSAERVREAACTALAGREGGVEPVLGALARHTDFLAGTHAAPLPPLAAAAASSRDPRAGPLLFSHLDDPATASEDLPALAKALSVVADASLLPRLTQFARTYHADGDDALAEAVVIILRVVANKSPSAAADLLEPIASDEASDPRVRAAAQEELAAFTARAQKGAETGADATPAEAGDQSASKANAPPARLTAEHLASALSKVREPISECIRNDPAHPASARLTVVVENDGRIVSAQTLPASLTPCVAPIVKQLTLPATKYAKRDTLHYTLSR
jgi:hypothetical protein